MINDGGASDAAPVACGVGVNRWCVWPNIQPLRWDFDKVWMIRDDGVGMEAIRDAARLILRSEGFFTVETVPQGANGGVDATPYMKGKPDAIAVVQCKALTAPVKVDPVRALGGVMHVKEIERGISVQGRVSPANW